MTKEDINEIRKVLFKELENYEGEPILLDFDKEIVQELLFNYENNKLNYFLYNILNKNGVRELLISHDFMDEFRIEFLNYSFFYFKSKLNVMDSKYKSEYFSKIKSFFETTNITFSELKKINPIYVNFYLHLINSSSYDQFEFLNSHYDERLMSVIDLDYLPIEFDEFIENSFENTNCYINVLENNVLKLNEELESSKRDVVNLKSKANKLNEKEILINDLNGDLKILKQDIANLKLEIEELSFSKIKLENEIKYLKNNNYNLSVENKKLKQEIDEIKSSKLWKLKNM